MDLVIRNARLRDTLDLVDIAINDGKFIEISTNIIREARATIDAKGHLVIPPFIDPHLHLDAVLSVGSPRYNTSGTLLEGIEIWGERKKTLTKKIIKENAIRAIKWEVANGVQYIRTHVDVSDPTLLTLESLLEVKDEVKDLVDLQVVAFPQDGIFTSPNGVTLLETAMEMGADVVGGIPHNELTREDGVRDVDFVFDLAEKHGALIDIHVDETGDDQSRFIEVMAKNTITRGMYGLVTASHTTAMHNYNNDYAFKLIGNLKRAKLNMITNPFDNSVLQNRTDGYPRYRGHTRVDELTERGVNVCIGHDSIMDPWYPLGIGNLVHAANLLVHTAHMSGHNQFSQLVDMITINSAKALNILDNYGIEVGNDANLVILDAYSDVDLIRLKSECLYVIRKGNVIVETTPAKRMLEFKGISENIDFKL